MIGGSWLVTAAVTLAAFLAPVAAALLLAFFSIAELVAGLILLVFVAAIVVTLPIGRRS